MVAVATHVVAAVTLVGVVVVEKYHDVATSASGLFSQPAQLHCPK